MYIECIDIILETRQW